MYYAQKGFAPVLIILLLSLLMIGVVFFLITNKPTTIPGNSQPTPGKNVIQILKEKVPILNSSQNSTPQIDKNTATENRDLKTPESTSVPTTSPEPINAEENVPIYY